MPARRATPADKQRVRTGCLTCRKRRRKCDEHKPRCENCAAKGFSCKYPGADLTFIPAPKPGPEDGNSASNGTVQSYNTITFVVDSTSPSSAPTESTEGIPYRRTPTPDTQGDAPTTLDLGAAREFIAGSTARHDSNSVATNNALVHVGSYNARSSPIRGDHTEQTVPHSGPRPLIDGSEGTPTGRIFHSSHYSTFPGSISSNQLVGPHSQASSSEETGLLQQFRYNLAPWIDIGDPKSSFAVKIMLLARANRPLLAAILALAARQRSLVNRQQDGEDFESSLKFREEAEHDSAFEGSLVSRVVKILVSLLVFLSSSPQQWRSLLSQQNGILGGPGGLSYPAALLEELGAPLFWLHFRIDLAASILNSQPPTIPFPSYLLSNGSPKELFRPPPQLQSAKKLHERSLFLLADSLSMIYGGHKASLGTNASADLANFHSARKSNFLSGWTTLWNECQKWYNDRPVESQQILDIRGVEADQIDPQNPSSFPIIVYTTPLALVSNAVYHITSLLLLNHKPRLLKALAGPRCFTSPIWHAQSIAGIATSNDYAEQWDPILVAGLLSVAKEMTHESQQSVMLEQLGRVTAMTGIKLDREIDDLKSTWNVSRHDEETVT